MSAPRSAIYLHVGPPKTGTTYLQDVLWRNRRRLAELDVSFPGKRLADHFHAALDLREMQFGGHDNPDVHGAWQRLVKAAASSGRATTVVSHEIFGGADSEQLARLAHDLDAYEVHVVFGARDVARQLPAVWQEALKNRKNRTFDAFLTSSIRHRGEVPAPPGFWRSQDIAQTLGRWSAVVAPERIHVVMLPQRGSPPDTLWRRFTVALGLPADGFDLDVARPNHSLSPAHAEVLRRLNQALPPELAWPDYARAVKQTFNRIASQDAEDGHDPVRVLVPETYRSLLAGWAEEDQAALAAGGYDIVGPLSDLTPVGTSFGSGALAEPDIVTDAAVQLLATALVTKPKPVARETKDRARALVGQMRRGRGRR